MAFRSQKAIGAFVVMLACQAGGLAGEPVVAVRHPHLRKGGSGEIRIGESSIVFREADKKQEHSREWAFEEIQQLYVSKDSLRILTYEDVAWKLGSDREYRFDQLQEGAAQQLLGAIRGKIDERRIVAALPDPTIKPIWEAPAKLVDGWGGSDGLVLVGEDSIVYKTDEPNASRTWHFRQIENVSSSGPFDLTITTYEQDRDRFAGRRDFRFQLKAAIGEDRYNGLWRRLNESRLPQSVSNIRNEESPNE